MQRIVEFIKNEEGLAVTEYGLLLALVAVAVIAVVRTFSTTLSGMFTNASNQLSTTATP